MSQLLSFWNPAVVALGSRSAARPIASRPASTTATSPRFPPVAQPMCRRPPPPVASSPTLLLRCLPPLCTHSPRTFFPATPPLSLSLIGADFSHGILTRGRTLCLPTPTKSSTAMAAPPRSVHPRLQAVRCSLLRLLSSLSPDRPTPWGWLPVLQH